ncbi:MAG TPA: CbtA family protein, partial [Reyranella sp.]|nr:CbtA family protein [Reyranella sp.]
PPASTFDDTVQFRSAVYFLMLALSIAAVIGAWLLRQALVASQGSWMASLTAGIVYVVVVGIFLVIMPTINEVPAGFPANTMFDFRLAALGIQAILWGATGVIFGIVVERTMTGLVATPPRTAMAR